MIIPWQKLGIEVARLLFYTLVSLGCGALAFRYLIAPLLQERYEEISEAFKTYDETVKNLGKLAGIKSHEYTSSKGIEKKIARDLIESNVPELEALKVIVSPSTWEEIEDTLENNPQAIIQLWEKYGHLFQREAEDQRIRYDF